MKQYVQMACPLTLLIRGHKFDPPPHPPTVTLPSIKIMPRRTTFTPLLNTLFIKTLTFNTMTKIHYCRIWGSGKRDKSVIQIIDNSDPKNMLHKHKRFIGAINIQYFVCENAKTCLSLIEVVNYLNLDNIRSCIPLSALFYSFKSIQKHFKLPTLSKRGPV
jgi:hypothetical protein